jgi:hypothetical protein
MYRLRSQAEIAEIRRQNLAEHSAIYPDYEITVAVSKFSPPHNGGPDWIVTRTPKSWSED